MIQRGNVLKAQIEEFSGNVETCKGQLDALRRQRMLIDGQVSDAEASLQTAISKRNAAQEEFDALKEMFNE